MPDNFNRSVIDEIITVKTDDAIEIAKRLAKEEGVCCGISTGANVKAALELSKRKENKNKLIVTINCDYGERYLSTALFE